MKALSISRLCLIGALILGLFVALSVATPQGLRVKEATSQMGGACEYCYDADCPSHCEFVGSWGHCSETDDKTQCCNQATGDTRGCKGGGEGCNTKDCCDFVCGESGCTPG